MQPGPIFFKTGRKCGLFGVCNEGLNIQYNYCLDEAVVTSKGSNAVISYLYHYIKNAELDTTKPPLRQLLVILLTY